MAENPTIIGFAGSTRTDSYNKKLVKIAVEGARRCGANVTLIDLRDLALPMYDQDLEAAEGFPPGAVRLKELLIPAHGMIIASPEYNSSISGVLKNAIDWASRPAPGEKPLAAFAGKTAVLMSASPGALGGLRGLVHLRAILSNINVMVLPEQRAVGSAQTAFTPEGNLKDPAVHQAIEALGDRLVRVTAKLMA